MKGIDSSLELTHCSKSWLPCLSEGWSAVLAVFALSLFFVLHQLTPF